MKNSTEHFARPSTRPVFALTALLAALALLAVGALPAGWSLVTRPDGSGIGLPIEWLDKSPFVNFAIPGLILLIVFGFGPLMAIVGLVFRPDLQWAHALEHRLKVHWSVILSAMIGLGQCIWIVVELLMTQRSFFLQPAMFLIGAAIFAAAITPALRRYYICD